MESNLSDGDSPLDQSVKDAEQLNVAVARNVLKPFVKYLVAKPSTKLAPFDLAWFQQLHEEMFGDVWENAGEFRKEDLDIGTEWQKIPTELSSFEADIARWSQYTMCDTLELAVRIHFRAARIHPFVSGNGRWARLLANIFLKQNDHPIVKWPRETIGADTSIARDAYRAAIEKAESGDFSPLIELHKKYLDKGS